MKKTPNKTRQQDLDKIVRVADFLKFAQENAKIHTKFHHYTTIDSLLKIVETKSIRLSRSDQMNDLQELTKGSREKWNRTYISSLCYGDSESIAMWTMYGIPWQKGVRLSFSSKDFVNWFENISIIKRFNSNVIFTALETEENILTDVIYSSYNHNTNSEKIKLDNYRIIDSINQFKISNFSEMNSITGYVKNRAWEYENETRIKIVLKKFEEACTHLILPLNNEVIKSLEVTFSPWVKDEIINETINKLTPTLGVVSYSQSQFRDLINISTRCSNCQQDFSEFATRV